MALARRGPGGGETPQPLWLKLAFTAFVAVLVPIYWRDHGPTNFLWLSDVALFAVCAALWLNNRLLVSMMAVGVLPMELVWVLDFVLGGLFGVAAYMFDPAEPLHLRVLSGFHLFLPPAILWLLWRWGYDARALPAQTALAWLILPLTWALTGPEQNINWVHGPGRPQDFVPPLVYLAAQMLIFLVCVHLPAHYALRRLFPRPRPAPKLPFTRR